MYGLPTRILRADRLILCSCNEFCIKQLIIQIEYPPLRLGAKSPLWACLNTYLLLLFGAVDVKNLLHLGWQFSLDLLPPTNNKLCNVSSNARTNWCFRYLPERTGSEEDKQVAWKVNLLKGTGLLWKKQLSMYIWCHLQTSKTRKFTDFVYTIFPMFRISLIMTILSLFYWESFSFWATARGQATFIHLRSFISWWFCFWGYRH